MGSIGTSKSSYLRKNHAGAPFAAGDARRFFVQDGFQVQYYDSDARTKRNGRFDLRNIVTLRPTADPSVTAGVELVISVNGDGVATKTITVSFDDAKEEAPMWKAMWCSAVGETAVDERLKGFRQSALVKKFNFEHCEQPAMKPTMFNTPGILTPRTPGEKPAEAAVAETPDTPRAGAPAAAPITKLGMPKGAPNSAAPTAPKGPPPNTTETAAADDTFEVTVPEGVKPGEVLHANTPGGVKVRLRVPEGATPGAVLAFTMPTGGTTTVDAAVKIQAIYRGKTARKGLVEEDAAEVQAASAAFAMYDFDGDGVVNLDDFVFALTSIAQHAGRPALEPERAKRLFAAADLDGNGAIDFNEFLELQRRKRAIQTWTGGIAAEGG